MFEKRCYIVYFLDENPLHLDIRDIQKITAYKLHIYFFTVPKGTNAFPFSIFQNYQIQTLSEEELIEGCRQKDRKAQKMLFDKYSASMFGLCKRYLRNHQDAEDILVEGLYKVMTKIDKYSGKGSFEGWIRRVLVNECLMHLRKRHHFTVDIELSNIDKANQLTIEDELAAQDIMKLLDVLPVGYRTVFNMYVLEGYKHREIAKELGISINTSKSQLRLARQRLQALIKKQNQTPDVG